MLGKYYTCQPRVDDICIKGYATRIDLHSHSWVCGILVPRTLWVPTEGHDLHLTTNRPPLFPVDHKRHKKGANNSNALP